MEKLHELSIRYNATEDERFTDFPDEDSWGDGGSAPWGGNMRTPSLRDGAIPPLSMKNRLSPPPAARMRNMMFGNGNGNGLDTWEDEEQRFIVHMRGLPYRATEQDIMNVSKAVRRLTWDLTWCWFAFFCSFSDRFFLLMYKSCTNEMVDLLAKLMLNLKHTMMLTKLWSRYENLEIPSGDCNKHFRRTLH